VLSRRKIGSTLGVREPRNRFLRLLRSDVADQASPVNPERMGQEQFSHEARVAVENAMLQAEYNRARAMIASQQARSFY
jgi:hypothetical protein